MPGPDGKLTEEERKAAIARFDALEKKMGRDLSCEVCGNILWTLGSHLIGQRSDVVTQLGSGQLRFPSVMFGCTECGNEKFFYAQKFGVVPLGAEPPPDVLDKPARKKSERSDGG
jgi:RNase P subunit RPR2